MILLSIRVSGMSSMNIDSFSRLAAMMIACKMKTMSLMHVILRLTISLSVLILSQLSLLPICDCGTSNVMRIHGIKTKSNMTY